LIAWVYQQRDGQVMSISHPIQILQQVVRRDFLIGMASPAYKLDIDNGSTAFPLRVTSSNVDGGIIRFENSGTGGRTYHVGTTGTGPGEGFSIYDATGAASRMLIDSSGNVGVGPLIQPAP
jgi:hypothetical protein